MRRIGRALLVVGALGMLGASPASASTTIGQTFAPTVNCSGTATFLQTNSPSYTVSSDGVLTSWSHLSGPAVPTALKLKVARPAAPGYFFVGQSGPAQGLAPGALTTTPAQISVKAGDLIGISFGATGSFACLRSSTGFTATTFAGDPPTGSTVVAAANNSSLQMDVSAVLEADADADGYGDETQDGCPTNAAVQGPCPILTPPVTAITKHPKKKTNKKSATFEFISDTPASSFECTLDGNLLAGCTSPKVLKVNKGKHVFEVRAIGANALSDATPARYSWKVGKKRKGHKGGKGK